MEHETLGRWHTTGETDTRADRVITVRREVRYIVHDSGGYNAPTDRAFGDPGHAMDYAAALRDDVDGRGRHQTWQPIDSSGRPID